MTARRARWLPFASCLTIVATLTVPAAARAQDSVAPHAPAPAAPLLTAQQLTAFAELIGEPKPVVWQRLLADPSMAPLAAAAADRRIERKSSGKTMTIVGFTILGVGVGAGYLIMVSGIMAGADCGLESSCKPDEDRILGGLALAILSLGVGTAIGVPGIIRMAKQTEIETQASDRYQFSGSGRPTVYPGSYSQGMPMRSAGVRLDLPLLAFRF